MPFSTFQSPDFLNGERLSFGIFIVYMHKFMMKIKKRLF